MVSLNGALMLFLFAEQRRKQTSAMSDKTLTRPGLIPDLSHALGLLCMGGEIKEEGEIIIIMFKS